MESTKIKISVIMPVYNSGVYLKTAVESILNQSLKEIELILVDDGSTDGSSEQCDCYAQQDSRVIVIHQKNGGICNARNSALKIAKGEYVGFCDHDDEFAPNTWKKCIDMIEEYNHPDVIKFGKDYVFINEKGKTYRTIHMNINDSYYDRSYIIDNYLKLRQMNLFRFVWDGIYKRDIILKNKIEFDSYFKHGGEDHDFCNSLSKYIHSMVTFRGIYYFHYLRESYSTSSKVSTNEGLSYYKVEGERLYTTLCTMGYDFNKNKNIYLNQIFESTVLALICYHLKARSSKSRIIELLSELAESDFIKIHKNSISLYPLLKQSKKLGFLTYLFFEEKYHFLIKLIKLRYIVL